MLRYTFPIRVLLFILLMAAASSATSSAQEIANYLPPVDAELFTVDRAHSHLNFSVRFMGLTEVEGTFEEYRAAILYDEDDPTRTSITLIVEVESIDTNNDFRDRDLRSERFFNAEEYPYMLFQSKRIEPTEEGFVAHGDLTIRGVTKQIAVPFTSTMARTPDPVWGNVRTGFAGSTVLSRTAFGVTGGGSSWGVDIVSDEVRVDFFLLGTIMNMEKIAFSSQERPSIGEVLLAKLNEEGAEAAVAHYHTLRANQPEAYNFAESQLNRLGYKLLQMQRTEEAIAVFELNAEAYPSSANVYSSLGEAYAAGGRADAAVKTLQQALTIDRHSSVALELLRHLE